MMSKLEWSREEEKKDIEELIDIRTMKKKKNIKDPQKERENAFPVQKEMWFKKY